MIVLVLIKLICFLWYIGRFKTTDHMAEKNNIIFYREQMFFFKKKL